MRYIARMIVAGFLGLVFVVIAGCGTKPQPEGADVETKSDSATTPNSNTTSESKPEPVKLVHEMDPTRHIVPNAMVTGVVGSTAFRPEALIEGDELIFQTIKMGNSVPDCEIRLRLGSSANPHPFENRKLTINQEMPLGPEVPEIMVHSPNGKLGLFPNGYALTLELGVRQEWKVPGKIYLCIPDEEKTILAGVFIASYPRQPTEPPGPEDLPYVKGSVNVIGAAPNTVLRVGYAANPNSEVYALGSADTELREPANPIRWTKSEHDKPRVTTLIAGDGKNVPSRYELSKLTTGRYLVFATLEPGGPAAWKWVTVLPGEAHTVDLTIDVTRTGGVEVIAPLEAVKSVQMVPADKPGFHAMEQAMFTTCTWQLGLDKPIIGRKTLFRNLAPGRYEVRAGGQSRIVEIIAGKTVELDFEKPSTIPTNPEPAPEPRPKG